MNKVDDEYTSIKEAGDRNRLKEGLIFGKLKLDFKFIDIT